MPEITLKTPDSIADLERILSVSAKAGASAVAIIYMLGLLVCAFHLWRLGIADLSLTQIRYVLVGADYLIFLAVPAAVAIAPYILYHKSKGNRGFRGALALLMFLGLALFAVPLMLQYFVTTVESSHLEFWRLYTAGYLAYHFVSILGPLIVLVRKSILGLETGPPVLPTTRIAGVMLAVGIVSSTMVFAWDHFVNVSPSIGGGSPRVVSLVVGEDVIAEFMHHQVNLKVPLFLWHQDDKFAYVAAFDNPRKCFQAVALDRSRIRGMIPFNLEPEFHQEPFSPISPHPPLQSLSGVPVSLFGQDVLMRSAGRSTSCGACIVGEAEIGARGGVAGRDGGARDEP